MVSRMTMRRRYLPLFIIAIFLMGCHLVEATYLGDGVVEKSGCGPFPFNTFKIRFPEIKIYPDFFQEYTIKRFPQRQYYTIYLELSDEAAYDSIDYFIEIFKDGIHIKTLDSNSRKLDRSVSSSDGLYLAANDPYDLTTRLNAVDPYDSWTIKITFRGGVPKGLTGQMALSSGGCK